MLREAADVLGGRAQHLTLWQQIVPRVAGPNFHGVTEIAQVANSFEQYDLHDSLSNKMRSTKSTEVLDHSERCDEGPGQGGKRPDQGSVAGEEQEPAARP